MSKEAMKLALEAMQYADACLKKQLTTKTKHEYAQDLLLKAGKALEEALAKQEQGEPRFWQGISDNPYCNDADSNEPNSRAMRWHNKLLSLDENQQPKQEQSEHWGHGGRPMTLRECMEAEEPQQRTWVGLTIEEREQIQQECFGKVPHHVAFAHAIEAKLKEKNT